MTIKTVFRMLMALAAALLVVWAFIDVGARTWRLAQERGEGVNLTVLHWGNTEEEAIVADLIEAFEQAHPGVRVQRLHANDYDAKLKTMLAAGTPPDLFYLRYEDVPDFASQAMVMPLDDAMAGGELADFYPVLVDAFRWNEQAQRTGSGTLVGVPKDFTPMLMYINLDLFEQAGVEIPYDGWTWEQYREAMRRIDALGEDVYGGVLKTWPMVLRNIVWNFGGAYFGEDFLDVRLDEPGAQAAMQMIMDARFVDGSVFNATGLSQDEDDLFRRGRVGAIGPLGRWMTPRYRKITAFRWDVVPLPHAAGADSVSALATVAWAVSSETPHPEEAQSLMKFLVGAEGQRMQAELGLALPSRRSVAGSAAFLAPGLAPANAQLFLDLVDQGRLGQNPRKKEFDRILDQEMQKALRLAEKSPAEAAAAVEARWHAEMASPLNRGTYPKMPWLIVLGATALLLAAATAGLVWTARRQKLGVIGRAEQRAGWMFISPWVIGFLLFVLVPMVLSLLLAMTRWSAMAPLSSAEFVGLDNFVHLFQYDHSFYQSLWVTLYYTVLAVPVTQVAALAVALLMARQVPGIALFRTAYFVPSVVTGVALVTLWITIFNTDEGLLNLLIAPVLNVVGLEPPDWFGTDSSVFAVPALVMMTLWGVGGGMVIYLAGLKNVPESLYEAATIDGAGPWRKLLAVTLPMLSPLIFFNVIMAIIGSFQVFTQAYIIRGSSGGTNEDLLFYVLNLYDHAFRFHNMGYASAMAWVLFLLLLVLTLLVFRGSRKMVHYEGLKA
jgi:multiple sugar transport system permease protein